MWLGWLRRRRRAGALKSLLPAGWAKPVDELPFTAGLSVDEVSRLVAYAREFEEGTHFEGEGGLEPHEEMVRSIALQACRLILNLEQDHYRKVRRVTIYPSAFFYTPHDTGEAMRVAGLAIPDGPVLLSWEHVRRGARDGRDGRNVVYHEFAHKLDMADGDTDGTPGLASESHLEAWRAVIDVEFARLRRAVARGRATLIDDYGARNPGEFFAESTEVFFERPRELRKHHRRLYRALRRFYDQDPARSPG